MTYSAVETFAQHLRKSHVLLTSLYKQGVTATSSACLNDAI